MAKYITPQVLRNSGTGFPYASFATDMELMGLIAEAEGMIDAYTGFGADETAMAGFAPGPARVEKYAWDGGVRRVYPRSRPLPVAQVTSLLIQTSQDSTTGAPIVFTVPPLAVIINNDQNYLEVSSFALMMQSGAYLPLPTALIAPWAIVTYTCGYNIAELGHLMADAGDQKTYHSLQPFWLIAQTVPVVYKNGGVVDPSTYTVESTNGKVIFAAANLASDTITCDFTHAIPDVITQAAKKAVAEISENFFARKVGLSGMDRWQAGGGVTYERIGTASGRRGQAPAKGANARGGGTAEWDWRDMLDAFVGLRIGTSPVAE